MPANPFSRKLGYSEADRLVIVHVDDLGMTAAGLQAFQDLWEFGTISSGAVMVPCPWFPALAEMARANPAMDIGLHATLNSEWSGYRWAPLSTLSTESGLLDPQGYFHRTSEAVYEQAQPEAVAAELGAQIERALAAGIDLTHIDSHMGTILHDKFVQSYLQAGLSRLIPVMLPRAGAQGFDTIGMEDQALAAHAALLAQLEAQGVPLLDGLFAMPLEHDQDHVGVARELLSRVPPGISHFLMHPALDTPELRRACPDWKARVANYQAFMSDELKGFIQGSGIHLIGYRAVRAALRNG